MFQYKLDGKKSNTAEIDVCHELGQLGQATGGSTVTSAEVLNGYGSNIIVYCIYIYNI